MPELIPGPVQIPMPGGKVIQEFAGHASTGDDSVSIAMMVSPAGWGESVQTPEFDEFTVVVDGSLTVDSEQGPIHVMAGQAVIARSGEWVRYYSEEGARYFAICVPAFSIETVHRSDEDISVIDPE